MRQELYITDGALYKMPKDLGYTTKKVKYYERHVAIDFKRKLIRFRNEYDVGRDENDGFRKSSEIPFA